MNLADQLLAQASRARVGMKSHIGTMWTPDRKPAIEVAVIGDRIVVDIYNDIPNANGRPMWGKFYTIELTADKGFAVAELFGRAALLLKSAGGSAAPPKTVLHR